MYLDPLGDDFVGMAVTFQAEALTDTSLALSNIEVHPTSSLGVSLSHPLFTVYPEGSVEGQPDPVDSFSNVSVAAEAGTSIPLGPGSAILTHWQEGGKLSINFAEIDLLELSGQGGADPDGGACGDIDAFVDNASPSFSANCAGCHGGGNQAATNAVDMTMLANDPAAACEQIANRINRDDPPASQIFIVTDPAGNASHPFKFGGDPNAHDNFVSAVTVWITAQPQ